MTQSVDSLNEYLTKLASQAPVPGGGSAALVVGAAGCSLVAMVARICASNKKYESVQALAERLIISADDLRSSMLQLREQDEAAFEAVVAARGDKEAMQRALFNAATTPLEGARAALAALRLAADALELNNANLVSDIGCAAEFACAALLACGYNVRINHKFMKDEKAVASQRAQLEKYELNASTLLATLRTAVNAALTLSS